MKISYNKSKKLLTNKYVLYFVLILSCLYLLYLLLEKRFNLIIVFGLISYIVYSLNKNMIIVLGISLIITFISTLGMKVKEGLENQTPSSDSSDDNNKKKESTTSINNTTATTSSTTPSTPPIKLTEDSSSIPQNNNSTESMDSMSRKKTRLDENAASINDTYSDINNILGNNGQNLNIDTKQLLDQQAQLTEAMKNMGPLIESAKSLMNGLNFDGLNNLASSLVAKK